MLGDKKSYNKLEAKKKTMKAVIKLRAYIFYV